MKQKIENSTDELTVQELINANEYAEARERLGDDDVVFKLAAGKLVYYDSVTTCNYDYTETLDFDTFVDWSFDWVLESIEWMDNDNIDEMVEVKIDELDFGDAFKGLIYEHH